MFGTVCEVPADEAGTPLVCGWLDDILTVIGIPGGNIGDAGARQMSEVIARRIFEFRLKLVDACAD